MNPLGLAQRWTWVDRTRSWKLYHTEPTDNCDAYKLCGPYGSCYVNKSPVCSCLDKFVPRYPQDWETADWSGGCVRRMQLDCHNGDGFVKYSNIKLPDTRSSWYNVTMTLLECKEVCLKNCSCMAYTNLDITGGGSGCLLWFDELVDIRDFSENAQDIYIRIASSDLENSPVQVVQHGGSNDKKKVIFIVALTVIPGTFLLGLCILLYVQKRKNDEQLRTEEDAELLGIDARPYTFSYAELKAATGDFNPANKLGQGGFGPVFKGTLNDGRVIAVKQLSVASHQGKSQFVAEIATISAVQHRNLVKLYGCCIEGDKRMLVYEYLENKSLDQALFGKTSLCLNWPIRFDICLGVARGLAYLHEESRLRIVHRDVKASNILLDSDLHSKISDFGLAKFYDDKKTHISTCVAGTIGYLAPEYAMRGHLTEKADVYGFGVVAFEIVSGRPNSDSSLEEERIYLLEWAWHLHKSHQEVELVDDDLPEFNEEEVKRVIGVALLCTQTSPQLRPSMSLAVKMLIGDIEVSPVISQPGYMTEWKLDEATGFITTDTPASKDKYSNYSSSTNKHGD